MSDDKGPMLERAAGPTETGVHPKGRAQVAESVPPGAVRYEPTDIDPGPVAKAVVAMVVGTLLVILLLWPAFAFLKSQAAKGDPPLPPMGQLEEGRQPAEPRLQTRPAQDLATIRAEDEKLMNGYGWVDEAGGVVHIPIEEAMRLIAERGLPTAAASPAASPAPGGAPPAAPPAATEQPKAGH